MNPKRPVTIRLCSGVQLRLEQLYHGGNDCEGVADNKMFILIVFLSHASQLPTPAGILLRHGHRGPVCQMSTQSLASSRVFWK
jgi:hypothetical protein